MLSSKPVSANKHDPTGPVGTIVSKSVANLRNISSGQIQSVANRTDRQQLIAFAAYSCAAQRGFEDGYEVTGLVRSRN
jgi:hypothetical protein